MVCAERLNRTPLVLAGIDTRLAELQKERDRLQRFVDHNLANWEEIKRLYEVNRLILDLEDACLLSDLEQQQG
jgi:hypothetical protein